MAPAPGAAAGLPPHCGADLNRDKGADARAELASNLWGRDATAGIALRPRRLWPLPNRHPLGGPTPAARSDLVVQTCSLASGAACLALLALAACGDTTQEHAASGAARGAVTGAVVGGPAGVAVGAAVGATTTLRPGKRWTTSRTRKPTRRIESRLAPASRSENRASPALGWLDVVGWAGGQEGKSGKLPRPFREMPNSP
jgi:hypothetical protein